MRSKPRIGVTGPTQGGGVAWLMTWLALVRAGGAPVRITTAKKIEIQNLDGLVLGGGSDIDPGNYGAEISDFPEHTSGHGLVDSLLSGFLYLLRALFSVKLSQPEQDPERDKLEKKLCQQALEAQVPLLGICRGAQMINIVLGGTLHQDIRDFYSETPRVRSILPRKQVRLVEGSRLNRILSSETCRVNSLHDQSIHDLGEGLRVNAREQNDVIQGIEHDAHPFLLGVQWHPEYMPQQKVQLRLFNALVVAAKNRLQEN